MTWCPCAANVISLLLFESLEKKNPFKLSVPLRSTPLLRQSSHKISWICFLFVSSNGFPCHKDILCFQKIQMVKSSTLGSFMHPAKLPLSPCAFHLCQYIKGEVFFWSNKEMIFFFLCTALCSVCTFSLPHAWLYHHMSKGKIEEFLPEALKASSVEQICWGPLGVGGWLDGMQWYMGALRGHWMTLSCLGWSCVSACLKRCSAA